MTEHRSPIPGRIYNAAVGGHVCGPEDLDFGQKVVHLIKYDRAGNEVSFESQVTQANKIYVIHDDFVLSSNVTISANCVLEFDGGSISGAYTITGNNTGIQARLVKIFNTNITFAGTWNVAEAYPEWFGVYPFSTIEDATSATQYIDLADIAPKLYNMSPTIFLSDGFYKTLGTINVKNLRGNGKTSRIAAFASANEYSALTFGVEGNDSSNRAWNFTIDGIGIYLQSLSDNLVKTRCLTIRSTTRCVINNITCWNYIAKAAEFTDAELDTIPDVCNYGIVFDGSTELLTLSNYVACGDIGIYFKRGTDQVNLQNGYIQGNDYSYAGIYGMASSNLCINGYLDIALGLSGICLTANSFTLIMSIDNLRVEQLRNTAFSEHKNYVLDFTGSMGKVIITNSYIPSETNTIHNTVPLYLIECINVAPGATYLNNEFINAGGNIVFANCNLKSNGKITMGSDFECVGIKTPTVEGNTYTGVSVSNGYIQKKVTKDTTSSKIYEFKGNGVFELQEHNQLPAKYVNWFKSVPALCKAYIKFFIIEIEVIDSQYYQKTGIRFTYDTSTNTLVFDDVLYNYGDNVFYPEGQSPSGLISIGGGSVSNLGWLGINSSINRVIDFNIKYTCIAPEWSGNRS